MNAPVSITLPLEVPLTLETLADAFSQLTDDEQARFFVLVADRFSHHTGIPGIQTFAIGRHLRDCECSTEAAREFLREIVSSMDSRP